METSLNTHTIAFGKIGSSLGSRTLGAQLRTTIISEIKNSDKVYLDFKDVNIVTNSFADECFRKLREHLSTDTFKTKVTFINTNDFIQRVIISTL